MRFQSVFWCQLSLTLSLAVSVTQQGCLDEEQYLRWKSGLEYLSLKETHTVRMKARRSILSGDMYLSEDGKLVHSPQLSPANASMKHKKKSSKSGKGWGSIFG